MSAALSVTGNERIAPGANNPPAFEAYQVNIEDLREEAAAWLDGKAVESAAEAEAIDLLIKMARAARDAADAERAAEKKPHDDASKAVQKKWKPLVDNAQRVLDVCLEKVGAWRVAEAKRKEAEAARIRAEADAERQAEIEATRAASGNLEAREQADRLGESAQAADKLAKAAEKAASTGNGLRSIKRLVVTDTRALAGWLWTHRREEAETAHAELAQRIYRAGGPTPGGTEIITEQKAV
jgi:preprotein translocase subunit SecD